MKKSLKTLLRLFLTTLYISTFTFGGGFVIVHFMKRKFVDDLHWIDEQEMLDIVAMAQSSPGAIAVNAAILVGWKVQGFFGMVTAVIGTIIPPMVILGIVSYFYQAFSENRYIALLLQGMQAGVAAIILDVALSLAITTLKEKEWLHYVLLIAAFIASFFLKIDVVYIIVAALAVGICKEAVSKKKRCRK